MQLEKMSIRSGKYLTMKKNNQQLLKKVYLTIDDSPGTQFTQKVDLLAKHDIPAVFFCIGELMEKYPAAVVDSIHKGFIIANHSYTHPAFSKISAM